MEISRHPCLCQVGQAGRAGRLAEYLLYWSHLN